MDQMQSNEDALQKAIDDITNNTLNEQSADAAAMPDLTMPEMPVAETAPATETTVVAEPEIPVAPAVDPIADVPSVPETPVAEATPEMPAMPEVPTIPEEPAVEAEEVVSKEITPEETISEEPAETETAEPTPETPSISDIKEKALRDLAPILSKMNINAEQKFRIYFNMIETLKDQTVYEPAYQAASEITDEVARGEALLKLIEILDK